MIRKSVGCCCMSILFAYAAVSAAESGDAGTAAQPPPDRPSELEQVDVTASRYRDDDLIGPYNQPRWTTGRLFPSTRVYVIPEGEQEVEFWYRPTFDNGETATRWLLEYAVGLPHRFQLDLYLRADQADTGEDPEWGQTIEVRWALADWGVIWGNPTLYFEWLNLNHRPNKIEPKLLLGGDIAPGWHWGVNLVAELEYEGPEREHEYEFTSGISRVIIDSTFAAGLQFKKSWIDVKNDRGNWEKPTFIGPTFQYHPLPEWVINLETLVGTGHSPDGQITFNTAWEF